MIKVLIAGDRVENGEKTMRERLGDGSSLLRRNLNKSFTLYAAQKKRSAEIATAPSSSVACDKELAELVEVAALPPLPKNQQIFGDPVRGVR